MNTREMRELFARQVRALRARPPFAQDRGVATARLAADGLTCDVACEDGTVRADAPSGDGGSGGAPHAEQLMRASVAAGLAIGYRLWGARLGVPVEGVEVTVICTLDARGQMGVAPVPVGWQRLEVAVTVTSAAPEADVHELLDAADALSPVLANLNPAIVRTRTLQLVRREGA